MWTDEVPTTVLQFHLMHLYVQEMTLVEAFFRYPQADLQLAGPYHYHELL